MNDSSDPKEPKQHEMVAYRECIKEKQHYDNLSWQIGAVALIFVGFLFSRILEIKEPASVLINILGIKLLGYTVKRIILLVFIGAFLYLWITLYKRNRLWAEASNEKARDFERRWGLEGVALKFMKVNSPKDAPDKGPTLILKNLDENGKTWNAPKTERSPKTAMHNVIVLFYILILCLGLVLCIIP